MNGETIANQPLGRLLATGTTVLTVAVFLPLMFIGWDVGFSFLGVALFNEVMTSREIVTAFALFVVPVTGFAVYFFTVQRLFRDGRPFFVLALNVATLALCGIGYAIIGHLAM